MAYFDQVISPPAIQNQKNNIAQNFSIHISLLERVEQRALEVVQNKYPYMMDMIGNNPIIIDPYANYSPGDSPIWNEIFIKVQENRELYARLFFIRGAGTVLVKNPRWGYILQPVIGCNGWTSQEQYDQEKQCLNEYSSEVIGLLKNLSAKEL